MEKLDKVEQNMSKYIGAKIWAEDSNSQALKKYDIFGPISIEALFVSDNYTMSVLIGGEQ